ncbi:MAG: M23 family metallopeptidase [Crocinitomicaceae bacterium]|nr:M23 family metallopeptidase [Crocinitomicaceae bacterium]
MHRLLIFHLLFLLLSTTLSAQTPSQYDYHPPLKIPLILASNFGELRPNHFHMGLDFKTNGRIGYNLYSVEEGYVSRIKVSPYGYGKVVYIDHPNGVTSVYAHCSEFKGSLDSIVRATQIAEENFAIEVFPKKNEIKVKRGEIIAISGNTGGSTAPHLHFELRDTETEHALNPLVYGFDMEDHKAPEIRGVKVYGISEDGYRFPGDALRRTAQKGTGGYFISENKITVPLHYLSPSGGLGLAFDVIDRLDGAGNQCGLYGSYLIVDGDTLFGQKTDRIPFESTRYVNCHKDYEEYAQNKRKFHKSFRTRENDLPIYTEEGLGILFAKPGDHFDITFVAFDVKGNESKISFAIEVSTGGINLDDALVPDLTYLQPSQPMRVNSDEIEVEFGIGTVYEPMKIDYETIDHLIGSREEPVHNAYRITLKNPDPTVTDYYIEMITAKGRTRTLAVEYDGDFIHCESKYFGTYKLKRDESLPTAVPSGFSSSTTIYSKNIMQWRISDTGSGLADYDLYIDGEWKLLEYEYKNRLVTYTRNPDFVGEKEVVLLVKDNCGNVYEWKSTITFK